MFVLGVVGLKMKLLFSESLVVVVLSSGMIMTSGSGLGTWGLCSSGAKSGNSSLSIFLPFVSILSASTGIFFGK